VLHKLPARPEGEILIAMAGPFAEARFTGNLFCAGAGAGAGASDDDDDDEKIANAIRLLSAPRDVFARMAKRMVAENWRAIEIVAEELLSHGTLFEAMLDEAIDRARQSKAH
jgi:hypothetical protein